MRVRILSTTFFTWLILSLISCENIEEDPVINAEDYYGDGSYFIELARLKSPEIQERFCGNVQVFELRSRSDLSEFGTTTVYSDGLNLVFQFNLHQNRIIEGWRIDETFVWVGLAEDWLYGRKGPSGGWRNYPGITVVGHHTLPVMGNHEVPLENWMFDDCIVVAARLTARFPNGNGISVDGLINHGDYLTYMWNEPFCVEECADPGTQTIIFWENNPDTWPKGITVGGVFYSEDLAIQIMKGITTNEDMSNVLFEEIVSAKLNVELGNTAYCIMETIEAADAWMEENGPVGNGVLSGNPAWNTGNSLANQLESYNSGLLCADPAN